MTDITDYEYAANGVLIDATFYRDGKKVAYYYYGGPSSGILIVNGFGWYLYANMISVSKTYRSPITGSLPTKSYGTIKTPATIEINSSGKVYTVSSGTWKDDEYIVKNNLEPVINFIIREFENEEQKLRSAGYSPGG